MKSKKAKGKNGLSKKEVKILDLSVKLWKKFNKLPTQHNSDLQEIQKGIHILQAGIMVRIARREYPHIFKSTELTL